MATFFELLEERVKQVDSLLCVGLDPHSTQLPEGERNAQVRPCCVSHTLFYIVSQGAKAFSLKIIEETKEVAAAYKPNAAFFEAYGGEGLEALKEVDPSLATIRSLPQAPLCAELFFVTRDNVGDCCDPVWNPCDFGC
jgi:orotidine-5'-phosphate decarboxylase